MPRKANEKYMLAPLTLYELLNQEIANLDPARFQKAIMNETWVANKVEIVFGL